MPPRQRLFLPNFERLPSYPPTTKAVGCGNAVQPTAAINTLAHLNRNLTDLRPQPFTNHADLIKIPTYTPITSTHNGLD